MSIVERLCLEEALLRHDPYERNWAIVGNHEPLQHRYLRRSDWDVAAAPYVRQSSDPNISCMIVMGIGGKPDQLLHVDRVKRDGVCVTKRFSGGGTVVLDASSIWTTFIGRTMDFPHVEPFPRSIMQWSANTIFASTFDKLARKTANQATTSPPQSVDTQKRRKQQDAPHQQKTLVMDVKSCSATENTGRVITLQPQREGSRIQPLPRNVVQISSRNTSPSHPVDFDSLFFALKENDYVLGERKMGGNAQSIVKGGWLHHTSFLWDYDEDNMHYLTLPNKRPDYRGTRSHSDFLIRLCEVYGKSHRPFFASLKETCEEAFELDAVTVKEAMAVVENLGGMGEWLAKSRTRLVTDI